MGGALGSGGRDEFLAALTGFERVNERSWARFPNSAVLRLRQRANVLRHALHVVPGETILELGAGSGDFTEELSAVLGPRNSVTAAVFDGKLAKRAAARDLPMVTVHLADDLLTGLPNEGFDYIVGRAMLSHDRWREVVALVAPLLKPGGQLFFFENAGNDARVFQRTLVAGLPELGFSDVTDTPYDIVPARTHPRIRQALDAFTIVFEHAPGIREYCNTRYVSATKAGERNLRVRRQSLATDRSLWGSTSVVVPCHNEEANVVSLYQVLTAAFDPYIDEFVFVDDCSDDGTAKAVVGLAEVDDRVKLVERSWPPGVGRALRDGYAEAEGRLILSMDCDAHAIVPEIRDMFAAVSAGADGAIGSRFSRDSVLVNYPFLKLLANRGFHVFARVVTRRSVRDVSNNLKLYRAPIFKQLRIARQDFAANAETGLRPIMAGYDIREVPISWIGRTEDMGVSSFKLAKVAGSYFKALVHMLRDHKRS